MTKNTKETKANNPAEAILPEFIEEVKGWADNGLSNKIIRAKLTIEGLTDKDISALLKAAGIGRNTSGFTQTNTLQVIEEGVSEFELYVAIIGEKAKNEARWISDRNRIRITMNKIYKKLGAEIEEEPATDKQRADIKALIGK